MGFLDNSRDIILDAVLTDLGRRRMAEGTGERFLVEKFALGDDEINYRLYDVNHPSGSAYYDLDILQTPVFEAFTNNISTMNSKLVTYSSTTLLYLPVIKLNENGNNLNTAIIGNGNSIKCGIKKTTLSGYTNVFLVAIDQTTSTQLGTITHINGSNNQSEEYIRVDQGLDNNLYNTEKLEEVLKETEYTIEIDNRFGVLTYGKNDKSYVAVDDDDVATYIFSISDQNNKNIFDLAPYNPTDNLGTSQKNYAINGKRGSCLLFGIRATQEIQNGTNYWFDKVGITESISGKTWKIINTTVTVTGTTTGYSIDIPVSFIKYIS